MHLGFSAMNNPRGLTPAQLGKELESRGFESLWIGEHPQIPVARTTPYPGGGDLPESYLDMMDPFLSLLSAAQAAPTLRVGTGVALVLEHNLFDLAKSIATLDRLTDGRVEFGVGVGWNVEELAFVSQIPWAARYRALGEAIGALRELWTQEESSFHGEFFNFDPVWCRPGPVQTPHPRVHLGAAGKLGTREAVIWADGWMPMDASPEILGRKLVRFREAADAAGRNPNDIVVSVVTMGDPEPDALLAYRELGVTRVILGAGRQGESDPATTLPFLDRYAPLVDDLR